MPLYEYQCLPERHTFEVRHGFNDEAVSVCPECGGPVRRVIQPVGIVFKGSGFYVNDSRKASSTAKPPASKNGDSAGDAPREAKESAPESKPEAKPKSPTDSAGGTAAAN